MDRLGSLVVIAPARTAGDPSSNPGIYIYLFIRDNFPHNIMRVRLLHIK